MSIVNRKGGFFKKLKICRNGDHESRCVLKQGFLKKTENYSMQLTNFFINKLPEIFYQSDVPFLEIHQHQGYDAILNVGVWQPHFTQSDRVFIPKNCYTSDELITQLDEFLHRFGVLCFQRGYRYFGGVNLADFEERPEPYFISQFRHSNPVFDAVAGGDVERGFSAFPDEGRIVNILLTRDNRIKFSYTNAFANNFYIRLSENATEKLGFAGRNLIRDGAGAFGPISWLSQYAISTLDERSSIDVIATLNCSSKVGVVNRIENREYIVGRFYLSEVDDFTVTDLGGNFQLTHNYPAGLQNLSRENPNYESNHLLNGGINEINVSLEVRYRVQQRYISKKLDCTDAIWNLDLLFVKKV